MLNGDKNALSKLQQVNLVNHLPQVQRHSQHRKQKINTEENITRH